MLVREKLKITQSSMKICKLVDIFQLMGVCFTAAREVETFLQK